MFIFKVHSLFMVFITILIGLSDLSTIVIDLFCFMIVSYKVNVRNMTTQSIRY